MKKTQVFGNSDRTEVMGILNVTPDSFSDGGQYTTIEDAIARARKISEAGADIIDIGGVSTRPGADPISTQEELDRVLPVVERVCAEPNIESHISIDTYDSDVAEAALNAGVDIINDQNGLGNSDMRSLVSTHECKAVLMDSVNLPVDPEFKPDTTDIVADVRERLKERVADARAAGISDDQIILDPGIGFATTEDDDLELLARTAEFVELGLPVLIGASRKSFIEKFTNLLPNERVSPSLAAHLVAAENGADIVRVHDVAETVSALQTAEALWSRQPDR